VSHKNLIQRYNHIETHTVNVLFGNKTLFEVHDWQKILFIMAGYENRVVGFHVDESHETNTTPKIYITTNQNKSQNSFQPG
jgi:hypothetical protein